jgi:hypothetical protein
MSRDGRAHETTGKAHFYHASQRRESEVLILAQEQAFGNRQWVSGLMNLWVMESAPELYVPKCRALMFSINRILFSSGSMPKLALTGGEATRDGDSSADLAAQKIGEHSRTTK